VRDNRPFYGSPLRIAEKPVRIESGWWDGLTEARDYYVAHAADGSCYWLFQERANDPRWFLHGLFG
jgi:protein ImuB